MDLLPENWPVQDGKFLVMWQASAERKPDESILVQRAANRIYLKQADEGLSVEDVCRKAGLSQQTYYTNSQIL